MAMRLSAVLRCSLRAILLTGVACLASGSPVGRTAEYQPPDYTLERAHWAFRPVQRPEVPAVSPTEWVRTPIDAFVWQQLERRGQSPSPPASAAARLRRLYLDLIGLLPTPEEQAAFLADPSPAAWERTVDELLARPEYGERWARHWLDVVRYAESNGYERDGEKPSVWRYRDWVIDAFNQDLPFDRFVIAQIAGDELPRSTASDQIATTFLRLGVWDDEPADPLVDRYDQLDDVLSVTATAFLGQTIRCARCHDHKFEPFSQRDYAGLLAVFEPLIRPRDDRTDLDRMVGTAEELAAYEQVAAEHAAHVTELERRYAQTEYDACSGLAAAGLLQPDANPPPDEAALTAEALAAVRVVPAERTAEQTQLVVQARQPLRRIIRAADAAAADALEKLRYALEDAQAAQPAPLPAAYIFYEDGSLPPTRRFERGNPEQPQEMVQPGVPDVLSVEQLPAIAPGERTSGRRLQLAEWIASPNNPLTARVWVNRVWQRHFGDGLVETENDFGQMGANPTHPELLDWLAAELIAGGYRLKPLQRQIVLSNVYQQASAADPAQLALDPRDDYLWRFPPRRLEAEVVRDIVLQASDQLNFERGGPSVFPPIAPDVLATQSRPGAGWNVSDPRAAARRSIYVFAKRTLRLPELDVLDLPDSNSTCEQRLVSTVAPQALTCLNGRFFNEQAAHLADRLLAAGGTARERIDLAWRLALCRQPTTAEQDRVGSFLASQQAAAEAAGVDAAAAERRALRSFCLVLLNSNEFVYLP